MKIHPTHPIGAGTVWRHRPGAQAIPEDGICNMREFCRTIQGCSCAAGHASAAVVPLGRDGHVRRIKK